MGMAASQTRFLQLTARKNNTEFSGQQINQQRTALANQSAGLFNDMLELDVPTAPSPIGATLDEYEALMDEYTLEKDQYDAEVDRINAQTEQIQEQDKILELKLKQLDSEQEAIQTEMDSVKKVIDKNIDSTFKTFA